MVRKSKEMNHMLENTPDAPWNAEDREEVFICPKCKSMGDFKTIRGATGCYECGHIDLTYNFLER